MFVFLKVLYYIFRPANIWLVFLLLGILMLWWRRERTRRWGRVLLTLLGLAALAVTAGPVSDMVVAPLENRFPLPRSMPTHIDGIIVLGGAFENGLSMERDQVAVTNDGMRLTKALELANLYPEARVLFTGGSGTGFNESNVDAPAAKQLFEKTGIAANRILIEARSGSTYESATYSKQLAAPKPGERWLLLTSAMHMPRAVGTFRAAGWQVIPFPVAYLTDYHIPWINLPEFAENALALNLAVKEWGGMIAYHLLGRTDSFFPGPEPAS